MPDKQKYSTLVFYRSNLIICFVWFVWKVVWKRFLTHHNKNPQFWLAVTVQKRDTTIPDSEVVVVIKSHIPIISVSDPSCPIWICELAHYPIPFVYNGHVYIFKLYVILLIYLFVNPLKDCSFIVTFVMVKIHYSAWYFFQTTLP